MKTRLSYLVGLIAISLFAAGCPETETLPTILSVTPNDDFIPEVGDRVTSHFSESSEDPYLDNVFVVDGTDNVAQFQVTVKNESTDKPLITGALIVWTDHAEKILFTRINDFIYTGYTWIDVPAPAMLTETEPLYKNDKFGGHVGYFYIKALNPGESIDIPVLLIADNPIAFHFEAVGELAEGEWALTIPGMSTTAVITEKETTKTQTQDEEEMESKTNKLEQLKEDLKVEYEKQTHKIKKFALP